MRELLAVMGSATDASLLDAVVEGSLDGVLLLTADGVIVKANRLALEILAVPHAEVIGRPATTMFARAGGECSVLADVRKQKLTVTAVDDKAAHHAVRVAVHQVLGREVGRYVVSQLPRVPG